MTLSPCRPYQPRRSVAPHQSVRHSMLPSPKNGRLGLRVLSFRGHMGLPHYGPVTRSPSFSDGFVNGLQNGKFPSRPAIQATGLGLLPRWDLLPLIMPAFAGRTIFGTNRESKGSPSHPSAMRLWKDGHPAEVCRVPKDRAEQHIRARKPLVEFKGWSRTADSFFKCFLEQIR
jgi:hypothetical protein